MAVSGEHLPFEFRNLQRSMDTLHLDMESIRAGLHKLMEVVQGEQERSTTIERAASADHAAIEELQAGLRSEKSRGQAQHQALGIMRKDLTATDRRLDEAWSKLYAHDSGHTATNAQVAELGAASRAAQQNLDENRAAHAALRQSHEGAVSEARRMAEELRGLQERVSVLQGRCGEADTRHRQLSAAHDETAGTLRRTVDYTLAPLLQRAERDCNRITDLEAHVSTLQSYRVEATNGAAALNAREAELRAHLDHLRGKVDGLHVTSLTLTDDLSKANSLAQAERNRLQDACCRIDSLGEGAQNLGGMVSKLRAEVADVESAARRRADQVNSIAHTLEMLRNAASNTDGKVYDLQDLLLTIHPEGE